MQNTQTVILVVASAQLTCGVWQVPSGTRGESKCERSSELAQTRRDSGNGQGECPWDAVNVMGDILNAYTIWWCDWDTHVGYPDGVSVSAVSGAVDMKRLAETPNLAKFGCDVKFTTLK